MIENIKKILVLMRKQKVYILKYCLRLNKIFYYEQIENRMLPIKLLMIDLVEDVVQASFYSMF